MSNEILQVEGQITKITTLSDGGLNLTVNTPDLIPEDITTLMGMKNKQGYFVFKLSHMIEQDIISLPEEPVEKFNQKKTPSVRLRNVLFVLWTQNGSKGSFDNYYNDKMELIINSLKEKLEPEEYVG